MVFQPGETSVELRVPILDDSLGVEGTEDFMVAISAFSTSLLSQGNTYFTSISISDDDETFVDFAPVDYTINERDGVVVLNLIASRLGALNYSVEIHLRPGLAQGW